MRNRENPTETFNNILAAVGMLSALYGLLQYVGYIETQSYFPVTGSFDNPAGFAASIVLCYPFLLCHSSNGKTKNAQVYGLSSYYYSHYLIRFENRYTYFMCSNTFFLTLFAIGS